jgi:hypothetical protein
MADASATVPPAGDQPTPQTRVFHDAPGNMMPGVALLVAGVLAFTMRMTDVFFAEATAWTFAIWGALFIYAGLIDAYDSYTVTDDALLIKNPLRFWVGDRTWHWGNINRMDIVVKRTEAQPRDVELRIYYTPTGELTIEREDRQYDPFLAQLILDHAVLKPAEKDYPHNLHNLPKGKATYIWNR